MAFSGKFEGVDLHVGTTFLRESDACIKRHQDNTLTLDTQPCAEGIRWSINGISILGVYFLAIFNHKSFSNLNFVKHQEY